LGTEPLRDVVEYYEQYAEESRLEQGSSRLEFERTRDILTRVLPPPPARVVDVGGAAGVYSAWLAACGHDVRLLDGSPRLVAEARKRNAALTHKITALDVGDARALPYEDGSADVVLVMGPLYHLPSRDDRLAALREAMRVLVPGGVLAVAAISRFASALDGVARGLAADPAFVRMRDRDLADGQHRNPTGKADYFTTAYLHRPEELASETGVVRVSRHARVGRGRPGMAHGRLRHALGQPRAAGRHGGRGPRRRGRAGDAWCERASARDRPQGTALTNRRNESPPDGVSGT
jgi:ubiquinone/menaquinone biosynthesis C-methylase UbiE